MFDRNKKYGKYDVSKAHHQLPSRKDSNESNSSFNRINQHYNQNNAHVNFGFSRSTDDQELNDIDRVHNTDKSDNFDSLPIPPPIARRPKKLSSRRGSNDVNFERGESIFFERKSIIPELETVIKWDSLQYEITAKGKTKKILDNVSGEVNNLEIMSILGPSGAGE